MRTDAERAQPDRYVDDHYSNAESANLADPYQRDHWMFGAGYVLPSLLTLDGWMLMVVV